MASVYPSMQEILMVVFSTVTLQCAQLQSTSEVIGVQQPRNDVFCVIAIYLHAGSTGRDELPLLTECHFELREERDKRAGFFLPGEMLMNNSPGRLDVGIVSMVEYVSGPLLVSL
jgi:hypothetical protein